MNKIVLEAETKFIDELARSEITKMDNRLGKLKEEVKGLKFEVKKIQEGILTSLKGGKA